MNEQFDQAFQQAATFQKMWTDSFTQMADVWTRASPGQPPPDMIRQMRSGMFKVLSESWEDFMRTPQFMEYMKGSMDGMLNLRKMAADAMTRGRHEAQAPARSDVDGILQAIRHMERRLLDRIEEVDTNISAVGQRVDKLERSDKETSTSTRAPRRAPARKTAGRSGK